MKQPPPAVPPLHLHLHLPGRSWWLLPASALLFAITVTIGLLGRNSTVPPGPTSHGTKACSRVGPPHRQASPWF